MKELRLWYFYLKTNWRNHKLFRLFSENSTQSFLQIIRRLESNIFLFIFYIYGFIVHFKLDLRKKLQAFKIEYFSLCLKSQTILLFRFEVPDTQFVDPLNLQKRIKCSAPQHQLEGKISCLGKFWSHLSVYSQFTLSLFPFFHPGYSWKINPSLLSVYSQFTLGLHPVYFQCQYILILLPDYALLKHSRIPEMDPDWIIVGKTLDFYWF